MPRLRPTRYSPAAHEPELSRSARRAGGIYYTPPEIARQLAELTLGPLLSGKDARLNRRSHAEGDFQRTAIQVLDPACGAGELLLAARDVVQASGRRRISIHGIDIDRQAVALCSQRLVANDAAPIDVRQGDALSVAPPFPPGTFDAVIGNPPYVSIRELARSRTPEEISALKKQFRTARGHFDLYVLFIERALAWLRLGGRCGLIVPNKWATLDYARPCRAMLQEQATIEEVVDLSAHKVFRDASVYPHLLIFTKRAMSQPRRSIPDIVSLRDSLPVETQVPTQPLGSLVRLACGTPGYAAAKMGSLLAEAEAAPSPALSFITSGNIDRYAIRTGNVRYQGRVWRDPQLHIQSDSLTKRQRQLFASPKIVIAGLTRRLEAAWDSRGLALGVQVFAATEFHVDPFYLLALLNSKLLSYLFRTRFAAKRLGGGYLAVNKGQLVKLPMAVGRDTHSLRTRDQLTTLARAFTASQYSDGHDADAEIDRLVYQLYRLSPSQIGAVEKHFETLDSARLVAA